MAKYFKISVLAVLCVSLTLAAASISGAQGKYNEAPVLKTKVAAGELPSVEERLPKEPMVIIPLEEVGKYGGIIRYMTTGIADYSAYNFHCEYEPLLRYDRDTTTLLPNIAKKWDTSPTEFTFYLREGIKWSDGVPFTADDIMFWYNDVLLNKELNPVVPVWFRSGGEPVEVKKIDDYTVRFKFVKPYGGFIRQMATGRGKQPVLYPEHYLKQFHPRYVDKEKIEEMVKQAGFDSWQQMFQQKMSHDINPDKPVLFAWKLREKPGLTHISWERNPYYWKVDPEGNQLPYINGWRFVIIGSRETAKVNALNGELDLFPWLSLDDYPLFKGAEKAGGFELYTWTFGGTNSRVALNLTCQDLVLRDLFQDRRFRLALSIAVDREEINELLFRGLGQPVYKAVLPDAAFWDMKDIMDEIVPLYSYNPEKANALLDEMGLTQRDKDGYRLRPDGKPLNIAIECFAGRDQYVRASQLMSEYWAKVGIKFTVNATPRELYTAKTQANEHQAVSSSLQFSLAALAPNHYVITTRGHYLAPLWGAWYVSGGKEGEEPPEEFKKAMEMYDEMMVTTDAERVVTLTRELLLNSARGVYQIPDGGPSLHLWVVNAQLRNIPRSAETFWHWLIDGIGYLVPEQFFYEK